MSGPPQSLPSSQDTVATAFSSRRRVRRVLLIEDEPLTRAILLTQLRLAGLDVEVAATGSLALKKLQGGQLDAMILELVLPDMSGLDVIEEARRDPEFAGRPIFIYTSAPPGSALVRRVAKTGGDTKIFNKLSIPVDALVSEVAGDMIARGSTTELVLSTLPGSTNTQALQRIPARLREKVGWLCKDLRSLEPSPDPEARAAKLRKLRSKAHALVSSAATAGLPDLAREAAVLRAFLKELCEKPKRFTDSSALTLASAAEALELLSWNAGAAPPVPSAELAVVVVDDDLFSRTAVSNALRSAGFRLTTFADPALALEHLTTHPADLVVLDVLMPKLNGPDLREKLRLLPLHDQTPVIFVASLRDLKRSHCILSPSSGELVVKPSTSRLALTSLRLLLKCLVRRGEGRSASCAPPASAAGLVVKPFISMELALKALSMIMKKRNPAPNPNPADSDKGHTTLKPLGSTQETGIWLSVKSARAAASGSKTGNTPSSEHTTPPDPMSALLLCPDAGAIEIDKDRKIIYSSDLCPAMFGWQKLIGQHIGVLLKDGLDNDFGRTLLQSQSAGHGSQRYSLNVMARRKDGTEFPASVILTRISTPSKSSWTAVFRMPVSGAEGEGHTSLRTAHQELQNAHEELKTAHDQLQKQYQAAAAEAAVHREAIGKGQKERERLDQHLQDISSAKADLEKQLADLIQEEDDLKKSCHQLRAQLEEAAATAGKNQETCQQETARAKRLEEELAALRQTGAELNTKLNAEQQAAAESKRRNEDLENQLRQLTSTLEALQADLQKQAAEHDQAATESKRHNQDLQNQLHQANATLETAKADLQKQTAERERAESNWREQLHAAKTTAQQAETAWLQEGERTKQLEQELARLRQAGNDLNGKLAAEQQTAAESKRRIEELENQLRGSHQTLENLRADLQKQTADRERAEADWLSQLNAARGATGQAEAARAQEAERARQLEQELATLRQSGNDLNGKLAAEQQTAAESKRRIEELENQLRDASNSLETVKGELQKQTAEREGSESQWRQQINAAKVVTEQAQTARAQEQERNQQLEQELAWLRQSKDELNNKLTAEQQALAESKSRTETLENQLRESTTAQENLKAELQKHNAERERLEPKWREKLNAAKKAAQQAEAAWVEEGERSKRLEQELAGLRQSGDELNSRLAAEQQSAAEMRRRNEELENRIRESADEQARLKAELEKQAQLESSQREVAGKTEELRAELSRLRESQTAHETEILDLENRIRDGVSALARVTADLEKERGERRRIEQRSASLSTQLQELHGELKHHLQSERASQDRISEMEQRLQEREEAMSRLHSDLLKETADRQLAEQQLQAAGDMSAELRKYLSLFEESKKVFRRSQDDLELRLQNSLVASRDLDAKLQKEVGERQRAEEALAAAQRRLQDESERTALDLARLQAELKVEQFERQRMEGDAVHSRYASLDSARVGRALVNSLRRQIRQPVEKLMQSTRSLLEVELPEAPKKLVESILENTLLLQTSLQEAASVPAGSAPAEGEGNPPEQVNQAA